MTIRKIKSQKILSPTQISIADFVINPYRGCSFGCLYCYAQSNKSAKKQNEPWGEFVEIKENIEPILEREINLYKPKKILLGSTTECFQPVEQKFRVTESILKILKDHNIPCAILTRSPLISEYIALLTYHPENKIFFTLPCAPKPLLPILEPKSPSLEQRVKTLKEISNAQIKMVIHISPLLSVFDSCNYVLENSPLSNSSFEVEFFNARMGNLPLLLRRLREQNQDEYANDVEKNYVSNDSFLSFVARKKEMILSKLTNAQPIVRFVIPEFNNFYSSAIRYD